LIFKAVNVYEHEHVYVHVYVDVLVNVDGLLENSVAIRLPLRGQQPQSLRLCRRILACSVRAESQLGFVWDLRVAAMSFYLD
jgi:hypothetical protein